MIDPVADDLLALRLRALAHPARLAIVRALARAERCQCGDIVRGLPLAQSTVSQHLKVLKEAGLITGAIEGPRSCYCLDRAAFAALAGEFTTLMELLSGAAGEGRSPALQAPALAPASAAPICTSTNESGPVSA
ncbi:metalloregulator ArsR/SmtB family transcription factor [Ancylobacter sp. MQZ15Z-1]|uniref:Metalloregulator ArsR/SmtB family transcription factor n=1 Tax=Ancylobacter mangrovi TaxID=2972472 RepID=A0A9X2PJJ7_9HYPH|nr:metalloregulator ArsR/SmtB family transcription factor [Ancylobacter mangrovi]MCS0496352.1 metalloregulator ArsR/SmtB family transcription factor [Ancylobacter mangrovi]